MCYGLGSCSVVGYMQLTYNVYRLICKHLNFDRHVVLPVYKAHPQLLIFAVMKKSVPYIRENTVHVLI